MIKYLQEILSALSNESQRKLTYMYSNTCAIIPLLYLRFICGLYGLPMMQSFCMRTMIRLRECTCWSESTLDAHVIRYVLDVHFTNLPNCSAQLSRHPVCFTCYQLPSEKRSENNLTGSYASKCTRPHPPPPPPHPAHTHPYMSHMRRENALVVYLQSDKCLPPYLLTSSFGQPVQPHSVLSLLCSTIALCITNYLMDSHDNEHRLICLHWTHKPSALSLSDQSLLGAIYIRCCANVE